jgi:putative ABC transport system permease protein
MRKALGVSQFVISLFFITTSILIYNQFKYFLSFDYGFQTANIVNVELQGSDYQKISNEFQSIHGVSSISACDIIPAGGTSNNNEFKKAGEGDGYKRIGILLSDEKFIGNLGIELIAGKNLSPAGESSDRQILVNEATVKDWGYQFPSEIVGQLFESKWGNETFEVIGVVKDFRYRLLVNEDKIGSLLLRNKPSDFKYLNVQISSTNIMDVVADMESKWKKIDPAHPFKYEFFDQQLQSTHQAIFDVVSILGFIAFLAIVIACLGLLGMAIYTAERKTKEVGIRKILGAEELSIALLLSKCIIRLLQISILVGAPLSYFVYNLWLQRFPNRVEFGLGTVSIGVLILLVLGFLTIGSQTIKASRNNPVNSLKSE